LLNEACASDVEVVHRAAEDESTSQFS